MKLPPWLWRVFASRRTRIALICSPFILMIGLVAFYAFMNWWGPRQFEKTVSDLKAQGLAVTEEEVGVAPPAEEDVLKHPAVMAELALPKTGRITAIFKSFNFSFSESHLTWIGNPDLDQRADVTKWSIPSVSGETEAESAKRFLLWIQPQSDRFDSLKGALSRPRASWPGVEKGFWPERELYFFGLACFAKERAVLKLASGDSAGAASDLSMAAEILNLLGTSGGFVRHYSELQADQILYQGIWEGIDRGAWTDPQLKKLQLGLDGLDNQKIVALILRAQIASAISRARKSAGPRQDDRARSWSGIRNSTWMAIKERNREDLWREMTQAWYKIRPTGFDDLETAGYLRALGARHSEISTPGDLRKSGSEMDPGTDEHRFLTSLGKAARGWETRRNLLHCGIAVERYRLKHGVIPETLDALVPEFLTEVPRDVCDPKPLRYQQLPDGAPHIWSLFPSGKDEGGLPHKWRRKGNAAWTTGQIPGLTESIYKKR